MKIILSRKGFDSGKGGCASPYMLDGTLLSLLIPDEEDALLGTFFGDTKKSIAAGRHAE